MAQDKSSLKQDLLLRQQFDFLTRLFPPKDTPILSALLVANFILVSLLGALLIVISDDTTTFILSFGIMLCAANAIGAAAYVIWSYLAYTKKSSLSLKSLPHIEDFLLLTDQAGGILYLNKTEHFPLSLKAQNFFAPLKPILKSSPENMTIKGILSTLDKGETASLPLFIKEASVFKNYYLTGRKISESTYLWVLSDQASSEISSRASPEFARTFKNYNTIFEQAPTGIVLLNQDLEVIAANTYFHQNLFTDTTFSAGQSFLECLDPEQSGDLASAIKSTLNNPGTCEPVELTFKGETGKSVSAHISVIGTDDNPKGLVLHFFDNSAQKELYQQIVQAQKTQAMGQLAGGIAHDFNNLLTAIIGFCDLLLSRYSPSDQSFTDIMQIKQNSNRAANLVRQLLAYSKQQTLQPKIQNTVELISDLNALMERLIGVDVNLDIHYGQKTGYIRVDRGQFEQVIINLVVNARDAMKSKGKLQIKTYDKKVNRKIQLGYDVIPSGDYVVIEVIDSGCGIPKENLSRIFDPFFSTKEVGQGTGLGLSTVYGIVKQTDGHIQVDSKVGKGTTFKVYLPYHEGAAKQVEEKSETLKDLTGSGQVLLVEDEDAVRLFANRALKDKGYQVTQARDGQEAFTKVEEWKAQGKSFDLVITDVVMPLMDGPTLIEKTQEIFPDIKVIFISGYAEDSFRSKVKENGQIHFLSKPFSLKNLAKKVKDALEEDTE